MKITNPDRLRRAREKARYTQADLAGLVGCTQQYISMLESGIDSDCSERIALAICRRLHLDLEDAFEEREIFGKATKASAKPGNKKKAA